jgi:citrate synthase
VFEKEVIHHGIVHADAENFFRSFRLVAWVLVHTVVVKYDFVLNRYDAHPMAILTSAFAYMGSYYSEANPSLQGQWREYLLIHFHELRPQ